MLHQMLLNSYWSIEIYFEVMQRILVFSMSISSLYAKQNDFFFNSEINYKLTPSFVEKFDFFEELSSSSDFYDFKRINPEFYFSNKELNEILVLITEDALKTEYLSQKQKSNSLNYDSNDEFINDFIQSHVVLSISDYVRRKTFCNYVNNISLVSDCNENTSGKKTDIYRFYHHPVRIIGRKINNTMSFNQVKQIYEQLIVNYFDKTQSLQQKPKKLRSIMIIANSNLLSTFSLVFNDIRMPVFALDIHKLPNFIESAFTNFMNFNKVNKDN